MQDKSKIKKILKYVWIIYGLASILLVLYLVNDLVCNDIMKVSKRLVLNDNWNVTVNETTYENVALDEFSFDVIMKGDKVILERIIPTDYQYKEASICIQNPHTYVRMYVDGKLEYEYGYDRYKENKATGSGYLLTNFYEEYKGKKLTLEYVATEDEAFSDIESVWLSEWENTYRYIITNNRLPMIMGSFLLVFGVMVSFVQIFAVAFSTKYSKVLLLSIFSVCIGIWTLCYYDVVLIFSIPLYMISLMENMALFIAPLPIIGYMYGNVKVLNKKTISVVYKILLISQIILTCVSITLHTLDIVHIAAMLKYCLFMFAVHLLFVVYVLILGMKGNSLMSRFTVIGMAIVVVCILYEIISYITIRFSSFRIYEIKGIASVGFTIFIGILVIELYYKATMSMMEENEKAILLKLAYTDELTKLHNRTYCSEYMRDISVIKKCPYTIINFDLNGLKKMNDTYGHLKGDELICYAALVLEKAFASEGVVGRMGGDEFVAIIENDNIENIEKLIEKFNENIKEVNRKKPDLNLSISYGYATSTEVQGASYEKVFEIADERMYTCKQKMKVER